LEQSKESGLVDIVGRAAARSLGRIGDPRAVEALVQALPLPVVHQAAVDALRDISDRRAAEPLIASMRVTKNASIAMALGNSGDPRAVQPLLIELAAMQRSRPEKGDERKRREIHFNYLIRALGKLGDPCAVPRLEWIAAHVTTPVLKRSSLSAVAKRALARIQEQHSQDA
jgi:HEAT repeat protein